MVKLKYMYVYKLKNTCSFQPDVKALVVNYEKCETWLGMQTCRTYKLVVWGVDDMFFSSETFKRESSVSAERTGWYGSCFSLLFRGQKDKGKTQKGNYDMRGKGDPGSYLLIWLGLSKSPPWALQWLTHKHVDTDMHVGICQNTLSSRAALLLPFGISPLS